MNVNINRRSSAWIRTALADPNFNTEVPAACVAGLGTLTAIDPAIPPSAVLAWPNPSSYYASDPYTMGSGIQVLNALGNRVPFRISSVTMAIGTRCGGVNGGLGTTHDITPLSYLTAPGITAPNILGEPSNRFAPVFAAQSLNGDAPVMSIGNINLADGRSSVFARVLSTSANSNLYHFSQADQLTADPNTNVVSVADFGYAPQYAQAPLILIGAATDLIAAGCVNMDQQAAFSTVISLVIDEASSSSSETAATDYYLYIPRLASLAGMVAGASATSCSPIPNSNSGLISTGNVGAAVIDVIPLNYLRANTTHAFPELQGEDNLAIQVGVGTAKVRFKLQNTVSIAPIRQLSLITPPAVAPTNGY